MPDASESVRSFPHRRRITSATYPPSLQRPGDTESDVTQVSDRMIDAVVAWGDVDAIRARVEAHLDAAADHVCVQVIPRDRGALSLAEWRELAPVLVTA